MLVHAEHIFERGDFYQDDHDICHCIDRRVRWLKAGGHDQLVLVASLATVAVVYRHSSSCVDIFGAVLVNQGDRSYGKNLLAQFR